MLRVVNDRDDIGDLMFLCEQTDHDVGRVPIGRTDHGVRVLDSSVSKRVVGRRIVVENQTVVFTGDLVRSFGIVLDNDDLVSRLGRDINEGYSDIARTDDDDIHCVGILA